MAARAASRPAPPSTIRSSGLRSPRLTRSSRTARQASFVSPPMFFTASNTFWPSSRTPSTTRSEIDVAFLSSHPHYGAVENQAHDRLGGERAIVPGFPVALHLPPHPAHHVLAYRTAKQRRECTAHPARVGAGQIGAGDQRISGPRAPPIGRQRLALPFAGLAVGGHQPGARNSDRHPAERSHQRSRPVAMPVPTEPCRSAVSLVLCRCRAAVASPRQRRLKLSLDHALDKAPHLRPHTHFNRVEPVVKKLGARPSCRM